MSTILVTFLSTRSFYFGKNQCQPNGALLLLTALSVMCWSFMPSMTRALHCIKDTEMVGFTEGKLYLFLYCFFWRVGFFYSPPNSSSQKPFWRWDFYFFHSVHAENLVCGLFRKLVDRQTNV